MSSILKSILKAVPIMTIIGWAWPNVASAYNTWLANKTPENALALGESAGNAFAGEFDPSILPQLEGYETEANPAAIAIIVASETPSPSTIEAATVQSLVLSAELYAQIGNKTELNASDVQTAALNAITVFNEALGISTQTAAAAPAAETLPAAA